MVLCEGGALVNYTNIHASPSIKGPNQMKRKARNVMSVKQGERKSAIQSKYARVRKGNGKNASAGVGNRGLG